MPLGVNTDAVGLVNGGDLLLSFDTTVTLGAVTADKDDLVRFDGALFTMFFDASAEGRPPSRTSGLSGGEEIGHGAALRRRVYNGLHRKTGR